MSKSSFAVYSAEANTTARLGGLRKRKRGPGGASHAPAPSSRDINSNNANRRIFQGTDEI
jgi:hypothetical protein